MKLTIQIYHTRGKNSTNFWKQFVYEKLSEYSLYISNTNLILIYFF